MPRRHPEIDPGIEGRIAAVRRFNRFYTQKIGVLREGLWQTRLSLTEARVLYELAQRDRPTAAELGRALGLDAGYLSRILRRFAHDGLLARRRSATDGRQSHLSLTARGRRAFAAIDRRSAAEIRGLLKPLDAATQARVVGAMAAIERALGDGRAEREPFVLRPHRPGDIGWVVSRHGALYAQEYGWDESFEALVAEIAGAFLKNFDPKRERCWIAERDGENIGSVFLVKQSATVAKLRLLLVEPSARGLGVGRRLVQECIETARKLGYRKLVLWTQDILHAALGIYRAAGFRLVKEEPHHSFGDDLVGQYWELKL